MVPSRVLFVVEAGRKGFVKGKKLKKMGLAAQDTSELFFHDVKVPKSHLLGRENEGFIYLMQELPWERMQIAITAIASSRMAIEQTLAYVKERKVFGTTVSAFQNTRFKLAELHTEVTIGQVFVDRCLELLLKNELAVRVDKLTGKARIYPLEKFQLVVNVNLIAPVYWALEMIGRIAEDRAAKGLKRWTPEEGTQGSVVFIGSISSQGNRGQISYASTKAGLEGAAATIMKEAMYYGVRCSVIHPGFTDTPMVRAMGTEYVAKNILPYTQLGRLIQPEEIADAICFMLANSAVSGELWVDAGWHAPA